MLSHLPLILAVVCGSCYGMEMRETVERMVMVRTTGSDLQPAATGYIYKKKNDGHESVVEMGESEVMEHLAKLYDQPKAFAAPIPVAKVQHLNKEDGGHSEIKSDERIIPVKEKNEDHVDGIADDDYKKIFDEYTAHYGDNKEYENYIRKIGLFDDVYKDDGKLEQDKFKGSKNNHNFGIGDTEDYHNEKYESYAYNKEGDRNKDHEKNYKNDHEDADNHGKKPVYDDGRDAYRFHKVFDKKDHRIYGDDGSEVGFHGFGNGPKYQEADSREQNDSKEDTNHDGGHENNYDRSRHLDKGPGNKHEAARTSAEKHGEYAAESKPAGQSYSFEIKH